MSILEAKNITKIFPGVVALSEVDISFSLGEIHCIIGENGAGKSTLIKCLTGVYIPEEGEVLVNDENALNKIKLFDKVAYVPQEIDLFLNMSVAENLFLPYEKTGFSGLVSQKELNKRALPLLEKFRIKAAPDSLVKDISVSEQQLLQIARATVTENYEVLMLDEPTTSLTQKDAQLLFEVIREIKKENKAIIFISHKLDEIFELGDVITVFRNGAKVAFSELSEVDIPWVITKMTGRKIDSSQVFYSNKVSDEVILKVDKLTGEKFTEISFELKRGEILGFSGLVGAGRSELLQAIFGYLPIYKGEIELDGKKWKQGDTTYSVENGLIYLPENRKAQGILPILSVRENISITLLNQLKGSVGISAMKEKEMAQKVIEEYEIKTSDMEKEIIHLSGGNQQKVIIGRSMYCNPQVLVFDEPTKGIDVGTKTEIYKMMKELAEEKQIGIILISSEMEEVQKCSNRIITLYDGRMSGEYSLHAEKEAILESIMGVKSV